MFSSLNTCVFQLKKIYTKIFFLKGEVIENQT